MKTTEVVAISVFGVLCVAALVYAIRQSARERERVAAFALRRGWTVLKPGDEVLWKLLKEMTPGLSWYPGPVLLVSPPPQRVYFFGFQVKTTGSRMSASTGYACLAERTGDNPEQVVTIEVRVPLLDRMVADKVETGGGDFRREFTVSCRDAASAYAAVNPEVQRILLDHITGPRWNISVTIARREVVVQSRWAQSEDEWDYLIDLTRKVRDAVH